jgi:hypothetical protein
MQTVATSVIVTRFVGELLATATIVGGLIGRWLGHTRRPALATGVAGFVFALGPGHNIPLIGGTPGVGKELAIRPPSRLSQRWCWKATPGWQHVEQRGATEPAVVRMRSISRCKAGGNGNQSAQVVSRNRASRRAAASSDNPTPRQRI